MSSPKRTAPRLLFMAAVAELAGVSIKTVSRWIATGELRAHKLGRQVRVSGEDCLTFVAANRRWGSRPPMSLYI
jgi:excisionase family DNA binding protein